MSTANLLYTDTEDALRDTVRRLFADRCKFRAVVTLYDADADFTGVWKTLARRIPFAPVDDDRAHVELAREARE